MDDKTRARRAREQQRAELLRDLRRKVVQNWWGSVTCALGFSALSVVLFMSDAGMKFALVLSVAGSAGLWIVVGLFTSVLRDIDKSVNEIINDPFWSELEDNDVRCNDND